MYNIRLTSQSMMVQWAKADEGGRKCSDVQYQMPCYYIFQWLSYYLGTHWDTSGTLNQLISVIRFMYLSSVWSRASRNAHSLWTTKETAAASSFNIHCVFSFIQLCCPIQAFWSQRRRKHPGLQSRLLEKRHCQGNFMCALGGMKCHH